MTRLDHITTSQSKLGFVLILMCSNRRRMTSVVLSLRNFVVIITTMTYLTMMTHANLNEFDPEGTDEHDDLSESENGTKALCNVVHSFEINSLEILLCAHVKKFFLMYESYDIQDIYPPWAYRGIYAPNEWQTIDVNLFNTPLSIQSDSFHDAFFARESGKTSIGTTTTTSTTTAATTKRSGKKKTKAPRKTARPKKTTTTTVTTTTQATRSTETVPTIELNYYGPVPSFMRFNGMLSDNFCDGPMPSPINIETSKAKVEDSLTEFEYTNLDQDYAIRMYFPEDGTNLLTVRIEDAWGTQKVPCISKGSIIGPDLCFDRLYIHYGLDGQTGSEHRLNGKSFGMEFQFFFTKQDARHRSLREFFYVRLNEYLIQRTGYSNIRGKYVRALSVFVRVEDGQTSDPNMRILAELAKLFWRAESDRRIRSYATVDKVFKFKPFFPTSIYYAYKGSLTFPPCFPDLDWAVFEQPIVISRRDFEAFLFIPSEFDDTGYVAPNIRNIESIYVQLEDRKVNKDEGSRTQAASRRKNREVFKSLPPQDQTKEQQYDYYEDDSGTTSWTLLNTLRLHYIFAVISLFQLFPFPKVFSCFLVEIL